jgi:hypothetical protein
MSDEGMARPTEAWEELGPPREDPPIKEWETHNICYFDWEIRNPGREPVHYAGIERQQPFGVLTQLRTSFCQGVTRGV